MDLIRPWGCLQSCCGIKNITHKKLKSRLSAIPFIDPTSLKNPPNPTLDYRVKELQSRLTSLEIFLKEYVVDIDYLETLKMVNRNDENHQSDELDERVSPLTTNDHNTQPFSFIIPSPNVHQHHQQQQYQQQPYNAPVYPEANDSYGYPSYSQGSYPHNPPT